MQRVERGNVLPPRSLGHGPITQDRRAMLAFMSLDAAQRDQTAPPRHRSVLHDADVLAALVKLFRGRCAFCEARDGGLRTYRFRPPAEALPLEPAGNAHLYYCWLADAWQNLYPICSSCQPEEPGMFPVKGQRAAVPGIESIQAYADENLGIWRGPAPLERSMLLDPCGSTDFHRAIRPRWDGHLDGIGDRGAPTIGHFNLNHALRVRQRAACHAEYFSRLVDTLSGSGSGEIEALVDFRSLEFGGTWHLMLRRIVTLLAAGDARKPVLSAQKIGAALASLHGRRDISGQLQAAHAALVVEDQHPTLQASQLIRPRVRRTARLTRVDIRNFRSIDTLRLDLPRADGSQDDPDEPVPSLLILGENATGKSTVLEAIALALASTDAHQRLDVPWQHYLLDPRLMGRDDTAAPLQAEVSVMLGRHGARTIRLHAKGISTRDAGPARSVPVFAYGAFRQYQKGRRLFAPHRHVRSLFDGSVLGNPHEWLLELKPTAFDMVVQALRDILSIDGPFDVIERDLAARTCHVVTTIEDRNGEPQRLRTPLHAASSGFRSILALACDVMQGLMDRRINPNFRTLRTSRAVVLVDEIEAHLHPRWKLQVMGSLRRALPQVTFIATTHDPLCLRGMRKGEVVVMHRWYDSDSASPLRIGLLGDLPDFTLMRVDQLLTSDFFQLYSTDDPATTRGMARIAALLAAESAGEPLSAGDAVLLHRFRDEVAAALPIGDTETQRLVQEAVADYLRQRERTAPPLRQELRERTRGMILRAMGGH